MPSERTLRHIDRLLDEADKAMALRDWSLLRQHAEDVLLLDPDNEDAQNFVRAAERALQAAALAPTSEDRLAPGHGPSLPASLPLRERGDARLDTTAGSAGASPAVVPASFASGRYAAKRRSVKAARRRSISPTTMA